jgi:carboxymethylenebutenolidase
MDIQARRTILELHAQYTSGRLDRRQFFDRLAKVLGSTVAVTAVLPLLGCESGGSNASQQQQEAALTISEAEWDVNGVTMKGYFARLAGGERRPGVIVIHENRGLNAHIEDVTRRMAREGFLALAPDILSPVGGTPDDADQARDMISALNSDETVARLAAAVPFLAGHPESTGKVGAVGFCWGGGYANQLAAAGTSLVASVPYYGRQLPAEQVPNITAALCLHYAGEDTRINEGIADYEAALKANNKTYELYMYEGAQHAFNNDTNADRYNKAAADLAWGRTVVFLRRHLLE